MSLLHQALMKSPEFKAQQQQKQLEEKKLSPLQGKCQDIIMEYKEEFEAHERKQQALTEIFNNKPRTTYACIILNDLKDYVNENNIQIKTQFHCVISGCDIKFTFNVNDVSSYVIKNLDIEHIHCKSNYFILDMGDFDQVFHKPMLDLLVTELTNFDPDLNYISCDYLLD